MSEAKFLADVIGKLQAKVWSERDCTLSYKQASAILNALRAQEQNEPLTCAGCVHLPYKYGNNVLCDNCSRGVILLDRYEPKGADQ